jgi:crossover junction endodeoxyribonuclease RusA
MYTPDAKVRPFKQAVAFEYKNAGGPLIDGPVGIVIFKVFQRPKSMTKKRGPNPRVRKTTKPDLDNVDKAVMDALTGIAYRDDAQICKAESEKWIAAGDETPFVRVEITAL